MCADGYGQCGANPLRPLPLSDFLEFGLYRNPCTGPCFEALVNGNPGYNPQHPSLVQSYDPQAVPLKLLKSIVEGGIDGR